MMIREQKIRTVSRDIARPVALDRLAHDAVPVEVVKKGVAAVLRWKDIGLV